MAPDPNFSDFDKRIALLEQSIDNGFSSLREWLNEKFKTMADRQAKLEQNYDKLMERVAADHKELSGRIECVEGRVDDMEPLFGALKRIVWTIIPILVGGGLIGIIWAVIQSGALIP